MNMNMKALAKPPPLWYLGKEKVRESIIYRVLLHTEIWQRKYAASEYEYAAFYSSEVLNELQIGRSRSKFLI